MIAIMRAAVRSGSATAPGLLAPALMLGNLTAGWGAAGAAAGTDESAAFPLTAKPGKRYLEDADGKPFLSHGDTAWSLIADLNREDVDLYLDDRRARGFNTILVSLLEHRCSSNAPANAYGDRPFHSDPFEALAALDDLVPFLSFADYTKPNEDYFAHADWVLRRAAERGFLVLLTPSYVGWEGGSQGWYRAMAANGPARLRQYGEYLGRRYRQFDNIVWVHAGDYNPPEKELVRTIAEGIATFDPGALHTAHTAPETAATEYWQGESWLDVNNVYTYGPVHAAARAQHARPEGMPFFLFESAYENEHDVSEQRLRTQACQALLSGAAGQVFGNNPIWHFDGPGLFSAPMTWQEALDSRGAQSMTHLRDLVNTMPWWLLEPDSDHTLLTDGLGPEDERAVAASTADGSLAMVYIPGSREITVDLARLAGPLVEARWYDPADGSGPPFSTTGPRRLSPESDSNSAGFRDWVLILESPA
jgi:Protein of unknown function (DUF4038)/Putative collagen-binding domain of a collagenase